MPPAKEPKPLKTLQQLVEDVGLYPIEAYEFVQQGLHYTVTHFHGRDAAESTGASRHVDGRQLCEGLRKLALVNWGLLARTVLRRWNITHTVDFGRIVFAMVEAGHMQKTEEDSLDDFRNVYDFKTAFESEYKIAEQLS